MRRYITLLTVITAWYAPSLYADGALFPFDREVLLFEPNQRALIAWNGQEEILVLSTDVYASKPTKALEVIPLPSEPAVKEGDPEVFKKATALINSRVPRPESRSAVGGGVGAAPAAPPPAGEVTFHERIGSHDISVTHVLDADGFFNWAEDYLRSAGADNPEVPGPLRLPIREYIERGFKWFVYDVVALAESVKTKDPIQFRFKSDGLFYPLTITRTESKHMDIRLLILTPELLTQFPELPRKNIVVANEPFALSRAELQDLSPDIDALLGRRSGIKLRIWNVNPDRRYFTQDLVAR